jgi:HD-like signal output (HDOD) protein
VGEIASGFFNDKQAKEDAFVSGLLHDIGKLLLAVEIPGHMEEVLLEMKDSCGSMHSAEEKIWGVTHAEAGEYLLGIWGLPYPVIEAVADHHTPQRVKSKEFSILAATHIANALVEDNRDPKKKMKRKVSMTVPVVRYSVTPSQEKKVLFPGSNPARSSPCARVRAVKSSGANVRSFGRGMPASSRHVRFHA